MANIVICADGTWNRPGEAAAVSFRKAYSHPSDKETGLRASDTPLKWMLDEARDAGLMIEPHLQASLTDGSPGKLHKSRKHEYRFKSPLHRRIVIKDKPPKIHPSVKLRYEADPGYRPPKLKALVEKHGWESLDVGT